MLKIISISLLVLGFILVIKFWDFPNDNKIEGWFITNKQKKNQAFIIGFGFILLGAYIIIKTSFF